ncbi:STAS domain-containing protein [Streptomyces sp. NPDC006314]|uniref:STAS domain-containing protein n=1 Tax=Streptomyces sp. NPDC006314 TaxID=3154475 RepID=UPI0033AE944D
MERILTITRQCDPGGPIVLRVDGELDHHTAPDFSEAVAEVAFGPGLDVIIDLSALEYCDSTGITVLIRAYYRAEAAGSTLGIAGLNPDLLRVFQVTGLHQLFTLHPTVEQALDHLRTQAAAEERARPAGH